MYRLMGGKQLKPFPLQLHSCQWELKWEHHSIDHNFNVFFRLHICCSIEKGVNCKALGFEINYLMIFMKAQYMVFVLT